MIFRRAAQLTERLQADPLGSTGGKVLAFPDGNLGLDAFHQVLDCFEGLLAVRSGAGRDERGVPDGQRSDPVHRGKPQAGACFFFGNDVLQKLLRLGMVRVVQGIHRLAAVMVADNSMEHDHRACGVAEHSSLHGSFIDNVLGDQRVAQCIPLFETVSSGASAANAGIPPGT